MQNNDSLEILYNEWSSCTQCALSQNSTKFVFGTGDQNAEVIIIGEAPGAVEDQIGMPFMGSAGQLLDKIFLLEEVDFYNQIPKSFITNIVKHRPPENRSPRIEEINCCINLLDQQIKSIQPKWLLCLGAIASNVIRDTPKKQSMTALRGHSIIFGLPNCSLFHLPIDIYCTYHPAALLYDKSAALSTMFTNDLIDFISLVKLERQKNVY